MGSSLTGATALCPWARHINPSLVLVQPRKTRPFITERLLMGHKESNQTNDTLTVFLKEFFEKVNFEKSSRRQQKHEISPSMQRVSC